MTKRKYRLPLVHVRLTQKAKGYTTIALVDSGATSNFLPRELAEILELDLSAKPQSAVGAGGNFECIRTSVEKCSILKGKKSVVENFENLQMGIPVKTSTLPYMILGRNSVFRRFDIKFQERNEKFILKRT